jgi:hypothetical protein
VVDQCFHHLDGCPRFTADYLTHAEQQNYLTPKEHSYPIHITINKPTTDFQNLINKNSLYRTLKKEFSGVMGATYIRTPPNSLYDWHIDNKRICAGVNILLSDPADCFTLFRQPTDQELNYNIVRCDYEQFRPTVFNSRIEHCIINLSSSYRYLLRFPIVETSYQDVQQFLSELKFNNHE